MQDRDIAAISGWLVGGGLAGASAPELLVRGLIDALGTRYAVHEAEVETMRETIAFKLPRALEAA